MHATHLTDRAHSVIVTLIAGLLGVGRTLYLLIFLYTFLATAFFLVRPLPRPRSWY